MQEQRQLRDALFEAYALCSCACIMHAWSANMPVSAFLLLFFKVRQRVLSSLRLLHKRDFSSCFGSHVSLASFVQVHMLSSVPYVLCLLSAFFESHWNFQASRRKVLSRPLTCFMLEISLETCACACVLALLLMLACFVPRGERRKHYLDTPKDQGTPLPLVLVLKSAR